ncbi:aminotransferase class I/II-fold pyridoxal phosphate-dependent enzyme [Maribacter halichondriae]|uniref:aminotransferase class I/II-fold pyridoxal phosphate-dependent enzyme n=1 Tax=Maribacter halichondriae TaxID=2980554 RepID=UPI0023581596|nr:aminotransferase class I/II-fold pyridoxal phosphate-dependent enzyme [Maribacter sp. Hal144]
MAQYVDSFPGREIVVDGTKHLYFGGTSYLGLQTLPEFQQIFIDNVKKYGTNYGASRNSNVRLLIFDKAEAHLSEFVGSESGITMSSGYLAGQLLVQHFTSKDYKLFYAPNAHSALFTTKTKPYTTYAVLNVALREHLKKKGNAIPVVLLDSIDFSGYNYPDFDGLQSLPLNQVILIVDDSHGIGVVGQSGNGVFEILTSLKPKELLVSCSLGKGFGIQAGAIFGTKKRIDQLRATDFFGGASPAAPAALASLLEAKPIFISQREKLKRNIDLFVAGLEEKKHFLFMADHPAFSCMDTGLASHLKKNQIITTNFSYPSDIDDTKSRIILGAQHTTDDIQRLSTRIGEYSF